MKKCVEEEEGKIFELLDLGVLDRLFDKRYFMFVERAISLSYIFR